MKLTEFFAEIFFKTNPLPLKDLIKNIGELNARTILAGVGLDGVYTKLKDITDQAIATAISLKNFSATTGLSTTSVQQWGAAAEQLGGSTKDIASDFRSLNDIFIGMKKGFPLPEQLERSIFMLQEAGTAIGPDDFKTPEKFLQKFREGLKKLSEENKTFALSQLPVSDSMRVMLRAGDDEFQQMIKNSYMLRDQAEQLRSLNKEWVVLAQTIRQAGNTIASDMAPQLAEMARLLQKIGKSEWFQKLIVPMGKAAMDYNLMGMNAANALLTGLSDDNPLKNISKNPAAIKQFMAADYLDTLAHTIMKRNQGLTESEAYKVAQQVMNSTVNVYTDSRDPHKIAKVVKEENERTQKKAAYQDGGKRL